MLIWNFLACFVLWYISVACQWYRSFIPQNYYRTEISLTMFGLTLPLAGWLADAYKMIYCSVWIMWTATILETLKIVCLGA